MADGDLDDPGDDGNDVWNIERVLHAERVGRWYKLWIKWRGSNEISPRWRHELVKETTNAELLQEIKDAVDAARSAARHEHAHDSESDDDTPAPPGDVEIESAPADAETAATPDVDDSDLTIAQRNALRKLKPRAAHAHLAELASGQHPASVMALQSFYPFKVVDRTTEGGA